MTAFLNLGRSLYCRTNLLSFIFNHLRRIPRRGVVESKSVHIGRGRMTATTQPQLKSSEWAMSVYGYTKEQRSAFWQFVKANSIPFVRVGRRKCMFDENLTRRDVERRSVGRRGAA